MSSIESQIDDLYRGPLSEFVSARTALAKTVDKSEAKRVKALVKPTLVPWTVNQLFWHARDAFDRAVQAGQKLREAQVAALSAKKGPDVRTATDAHRAAVTAASAVALKLAARTDAHPSADEVLRTIEALSLSKGGGEPPGRLTKALAPAGFEALAGVEVKAPARGGDARGSVNPWAAAASVASHPEKSASSPKFKIQASKADLAKAAAQERQAAREKEAERAREAEARKKQAAVKKAEGVLADAQDAEAKARSAWQRARDRMVEAQRALDEILKP